MASFVTKDSKSMMVCPCGSDEWKTGDTHIEKITDEIDRHYVTLIISIENEVIDNHICKRCNFVSDKYAKYNWANKKLVYSRKVIRE